MTPINNESKFKSPSILTKQLLTPTTQPIRSSNSIVSQPAIPTINCTNTSETSTSADKEEPVVKTTKLSQLRSFNFNTASAPAKPAINFNTVGTNSSSVNSNKVYATSGTNTELETAELQPRTKNEETQTQFDSDFEAPEIALRKQVIIVPKQLKSVEVATSTDDLKPGEKQNHIINDNRLVLLARTRNYDRNQHLAQKNAENYLRYLLLINGYKRDDLNKLREMFGQVFADLPFFNPIDRNTLSLHNHGLIKSLIKLSNRKHVSFNFFYFFCH